MATQSTPDARSWIDGEAARRVSDIVLGGVLLAAGAVTIASVDGSPFARLDQLDVWFFPAVIAGLLVSVGAILVVRGCFLRAGPPARWSLVGLLIAGAAIGAVVLAAQQWGYGPALLFGPAEFVAQIVLLLAVAIALARASRARAMGMVLLGFLLASVGTDVSTGTLRLTMGLADLADGITQPIAALGLMVVADGVLCLVSPALLVATYARLVAGWAAPGVPALAGVGLRVAAALAVAAACTYAYQLNAAWFDVGLIMVLGAFGIACKLVGWNRLVLILALGYGPILEENIRRAMMISRGDPATFLWRPLSAAMLLLACGILAVVALLSVWRILLRGRSPA